MARWPTVAREASDQPMTPAVKSKITGLRKSPVTMIDHCALIEALPIAGS